MRRMKSDAELITEGRRDSRQHIERGAAHRPFDGAHVFLPDLGERTNLSLRDACGQARGADLSADPLIEFTRSLSTDIGGTGPERTHEVDRAP